MPRLLGRKVFVETLHRAVQEGRIVLRDVRPDGSQNTYWRKPPSLEEFANKGLEIVPIEHAELHKLDPELLHPGRLPELWQSDSGPITAGEIRGSLTEWTLPNSRPTRCCLRQSRLPFRRVH